MLELSSNHESLRSAGPQALIFSLFVAGVLIGAGPAFGSGYTITDLGPDITANAINASGQVVGTENNTPIAFRTSAGNPIVDLGTLGGTYSYGLGINNSGEAVGYSYIAGDSVYHAFRTSANGSLSAATDLGTPGGIYSDALGINSSGQTVGFSVDFAGDGVKHAFRTSPNGSITSSSDLGGTNSEADGINDQGQVVGESNGFAFRTAPNGAITPSSLLSDFPSAALAINASGQTVGSYEANADRNIHAFRTTATGGLDTATDDLGTLGTGLLSEALAINDQGQVVGFSYITPDSNSLGVSHGFFADSNGPMQDLNDLIPPGTGWVLGPATGINDLGQITGGGALNGVGESYLLTPTSVPEPASFSLLGLSCILLTGRRRKRQR
jgi:probable HAF family extracellular repeat protein